MGAAGPATGPAARAVGGRRTAGAPPGPLRRALDGLYDAGAALAGLCLVAMLGLIVAQMVARWTGETLRGASDYAGYCMAAASFLAFAHALNRGSHIRVGLLLGALGPVAGPDGRTTAARRALETLCLAAGAAVSVYLAFYAVRAVRWSWRFGDVSQGQDATPLWIPQSAMAVGAVLLAVAFVDNLALRLFTGRDRIVPDAESAGRGGAAPEALAAGPGGDPGTVPAPVEAHATRGAPGPRGV